MRGIAFILVPAMILAGGAGAGTAAPPPIKLAVFPFELEDYSAGAALIPADEIDREQLQSALQGLKGLFEDDRARLDAQADAHSQDYRQILRMLEDIHRSFSNLPQT